MDDTTYNFKAELLRKIKEPWCSAFTGYFIFIIVLFCILGVVIPFLFLDNDTISHSISSSISTYFIALMASSAIEIILSFSTNNKASFAIYSIALFVLGVVLLYLSNYLANSWSLIPALIGLILSFLFWIIANADNPKLNDNYYNEELQKKTDNLKKRWDNGK